MTKAPKLSKTCEATKKTKPLVLGAAAVTQILNAFTLMPLHALAEGRNQSVRSLLQDLTGLSKARIAKGNLDSIRPSTQQKIDKHLQQWLEHELNDPEATSQVRERVATAPLTRSGANAPWGGWVHMFQHLPELPLPISTVVALEVDELVESLLKACRSDDLSQFKQAWLNHIESHGLAVRIGDERVALPASAADIDTLQRIESWTDAVQLTKKAIDHLYLNVITSLDAEWSSYYFTGRQTMPLFPLVMVRPQDGLLETKKAASSKNLIYRPSRRLLEFLYALVFNIRYKKWPAKPPAVKTLVDALDDPSQDDAFTASDVSNHFDGTLKLTLDLTYEYWIRLYQHFLPAKKEGDRANPPFPMILLALQWQVLLVQDKGRSFILLDLEKYNTLWSHRRQQWKAQQAEQDTDRPNIVTDH